MNGTQTENFYYTQDHLGGIREVTDGMSIIRARYDYDPWGRRTKLNGDVDADFGFTGFYHDTASGLDLTWYRAYSVEMGRWLSRDPLEEISGINSYVYVSNSVVNYFDPDGFLKLDPDRLGKCWRDFLMCFLKAPLPVTPESFSCFVGENLSEVQKSMNQLKANDVASNLRYPKKSSIYRKLVKSVKTYGTLAKGFGVMGTVILAIAIENCIFDFIECLLFP